MAKGEPMRQGVHEAVKVVFFDVGKPNEGMPCASGRVEAFGDDMRATIIIACDGRLDVMVGKRRYALETSDACLVPSGTAWLVQGPATGGETDANGGFAGEAPRGKTDGGEWSAAIVSLDMQSLELIGSGTIRVSDSLRRLCACAGKGLVVPKLCDEDLRLLLRRLSFMLALESDHNRLTLLGMTGDLLACLDRRVATQTGRGHGSLQAGDVLAYLEEHLADVTLRDAADHFYCHPNSISNMLRRSYGISFSNALTDARMRRAARLLLTTDRTVQDIAYACGYRNMTHFYELFRTRFGTSPGEWRAEHMRLAS